MKRTSKTWLSGVRATSAVLGVTAAALGGLALGPATAANAAEGLSKNYSEPALANLLPNDAALQPNGYYCGPSSTRIALSTHGLVPAPDTLAVQLGTTTGGTDSAFEISRVLNFYLGADRYTTTEIPGQRATAAEVDELQNNMVNTINGGDVMVANIVGTVRDTDGDVHSYEGGHYIAVVGYADHGRLATIADPADRVGDNHYQVPTDKLGHWIASRGYSH